VRLVAAPADALELLELVRQAEQMEIGGNEAGQVMRDGEQVEIGGNDRYVSLCRKHYLEGRAFK
jgi:thymidine kinase